MLQSVHTQYLKCTCTCTYTVYPLYNGHFGTLLCYTEVSFMWRLFYTVRNVIGTLGAVR